MRVLVVELMERMGAYPFLVDVQDEIVRRFLSYIHDHMKIDYSVADGSVISVPRGSYLIKTLYLDIPKQSPKTMSELKQLVAVIQKILPTGSRLYFSKKVEKPDPRGSSTFSTNTGWLHNKRDTFFRK